MKDWGSLGHIYSSWASWAFNKYTIAKHEHYETLIKVSLMLSLVGRPGFLEPPSEWSLFNGVPILLLGCPFIWKKVGRGAPNRWIALEHRNHLGCFMTMSRLCAWDDFKKEHWASPFE